MHLNSTLLAALGAMILLVSSFTSAFDYNQNGLVQTDDLTFLLGQFGQTCSSETPCADITGNGEVNSADLVLLLAFFGEPSFDSVQNVSECVNITSPGYYTLVQSVESSGSCISIESGNVVLDCKGNDIVYGNDGTFDFRVYGVRAENVHKVAVINCNIIQPSESLLGTTAIEFVEVGPSVISENTIKLNSLSSIGISALGGGLNLVGNTVTAYRSLSSALSFRDLRLWSVENNHLILEGDDSIGARFEGISFEDGPFAIPSPKIVDLEIESIGSRVQGLVLNQTDRLVFVNGSVLTSGSDSVAVFHSDFVNVVYENMLFGSGGNGLVFDLDSNQHNSSITLSENSFQIISNESIIFSDLGTGTFFLFDNQPGVMKHTMSAPGLLVKVVDDSQGSLSFEHPVYFAAPELADVVNFSMESLFIANQSGIVSSARVVLNQVNSSHSAIYRNGIICSTCQNISVSENKISFQISEAGTYTLSLPQEPPAPAEELVILPRRSGDAGCLTEWTCSEWSVCSKGQQTRACTKAREICYAPPKLKPLEVQNCTEIVPETQNASVSEGAFTQFVNGITGAVVGLNQSTRGIFGVVVFLLIIGGAVVAVAQIRKARFNR